MKPKILLFILPILTLGGIIVLLNSNENSEHQYLISSDTKLLSERLARVDDAIEQLRQQQQLTKTQLPTDADKSIQKISQPGTAIGSVTTSRETTAEIATPIPPTQQAIEQLRQLRLGQLQNAFAAEEPDNGWSIPAEEQLTKLVSQSTSSSSLLDVQCRATLCQLDLAYVNEEAMSDFFKYFPNALAWNASGEITAREENNGQIRIKLFLSRDGHSLPEG